jgi:hypothetical protein
MEIAHARDHLPEEVVGDVKRQGLARSRGVEGDGHNGTASAGFEDHVEGVLAWGVEDLVEADDVGMIYLWKHVTLGLDVQGYEAHLFHDGNLCGNR